MVNLLYSIDLEILYFFNHTLSFPLLDKFFIIITNVNNWFIAYLILLSASFFKGGIKGKIAVAGVILLIIFTDQFSYKILKELFQRPRPCIALGNIITPLGCNGTWSFPSNHAVNNFAAATFYFILFPKLKWPLYISALLVSLSRIYLGLHYPSDVAGGAVIGIVSGYVFALLAVKINTLFENHKTGNIRGEKPISYKIGNILIRKSRKEDIPLILNFIKELAEFEKLTDHVSATEEILKDSLFGKKRFAEAFIAEYNKEPAGQVLFFHNFSTFKGKPGLYIEDLYVKPEYRGKGIGKALLKYVMELAKSRDCARIEWVVLNWNKQAIDFYKKMGALPMEDWTTFRISSEKF